MTTSASYADFGETARQVLAGLAGTAQAAGTSSPQPELNGLLLQLPGNDKIYLVLNGYRCHVPDVTTLQGLFVNNPKIVQDINIGLVSEGQPLSSGAITAKGPAATIYLVSKGVNVANVVKWGIPSMDVFNRYQFDTSKTQQVPQIVIDAVPTGPNVQPPSPITA